MGNEYMMAGLPSLGLGKYCAIVFVPLGKSQSQWLPFRCLLNHKQYVAGLLPVAYYFSFISRAFLVEFKGIQVYGKVRYIKLLPILMTYFFSSLTH